LKRADRLDDAEGARLDAIFATCAELARAWAMPQEPCGLHAAQELAQREGTPGPVRSHVGTDPLPE
jgi:hypothetical protein